MPVNMAMLSTRNIEYIIFIFSLVLLLYAKGLKSWRFWVASATLGLLIASDKFFLTLTLGGALIALIVYATWKVWPLVSLSVNWLALSVAAAIIAFVILRLITALRLTHLTSVTNSSPYGLDFGLKDIGLGVLYAALGLLANFGANPAFGTTQVRQIPHQILTHLFSLSGPAYIVNCLLFIFGLYAVYKVVVRGFKVKHSPQAEPPNKAHWLSVMLIATTVVAIISFIFTNHYYAVDARYLTIALFAAVVATATWTRTKTWNTRALIFAGFVITVSICFGVVGATQNYNNDVKALAFQSSRNSSVAHILDQHKVDLLVGDYWRVLPIQQSASGNLTVMPLSSCTTPLQTLSSQAWQPSLSHTKFAYLLTLSGSLTNYPTCSLDEVTKTYGRPNASSVIAGSLNNPQELLLFYDQGIQRSAPVNKATANVSETILPISLANLPYTSCSVPGVMNVVAHQDDDLLFFNPDLYNLIKAGDCVRTVYITAGDAGTSGDFYWLEREQAAESAYSYMLGSNVLWVQRVVELSPHEYITVANPQGNSRISLIFMHLPDGNLKGQGFRSSNFESLAKLKNGSIKDMSSVDNQSYYSSSDLINALATIMITYDPTQINTQSQYPGTKFPDHSDHLSVGWLTKQAYSQYEARQYNNEVVIPIKYYIGYPIHEMPANVGGTALTEKENIFLAYAKYDPGVCQTLEACSQIHTYNAYLTREYPNSY